jgi:hypothetical protein
MRKARRNRTYVSVGIFVGSRLRKSSRCWSEWQDLNLRPPRPERGARPSAESDIGIVAERRSSAAVLECLKRKKHSLATEIDGRVGAGSVRNSRLPSKGPYSPACAANRLKNKSLLWPLLGAIRRLQCDLREVAGVEAEDGPLVRHDAAAGRGRQPFEADDSSGPCLRIALQLPPCWRKQDLLTCHCWLCRLGASIFGYAALWTRHVPIKDIRIEPMHNFPCSGTEADKLFTLPWAPAVRAINNSFVNFVGRHRSDSLDHPITDAIALLVTMSVTSNMVPPARSGRRPGPRQGTGCRNAFMCRAV